MFDRVAARYDAAELGDDGRPAPPLARAGRRPRRAGAGRRRPRRLLRHRRPDARAGPPGRARTATWSAATSPSRCSTWRARRRRRRGAAGVRFEWADALAASLRRRPLRRGHRRLRRPQPRRPRPRAARRWRGSCAPAGGWSILEITQPARPPLSTFYSLWFDRIVPVLGTLSGDPEAYAYLPESVRSFPDPHGLAEKMDARRAASASATRSSPAGSSRSTAASAG